MRIADIVMKRGGRAGAWCVIRDKDDPLTVALYHYSTKRLVWTDDILKSTAMDYNLGRGSVSDQNGVNIAFKVLGLPWIYRRDQRGGGPRIVATRLP